MITGRKIGSISDPAIVTHVPGTSEIPAGERVSKPRGTRQSAPNVYPPLDLLVAADANSHTHQTNRAANSRRTVARQIAQPSVSSAARRPSTAPAPSTVVSSATDKIKPNTDRTLSAAKWLREEKAKVC